MIRSTTRGLFAVLMLLVLALSGRAVAEGGFIAGVEALPLMPGLSEIAEAGMVFDKPEGRIVEAFAEGPVSEQAVAEFYGTTLPQLGWQAGPGLSFQREGEQLQIDIRKEGAGVTVQYTLSPQ